MNKQARASELRHLQKEANQPKHELIRLAQSVEGLSKTAARRLETILGKLEAWQQATFIKP